MIVFGFFSFGHSCYVYQSKTCLCSLDLDFRLHCLMRSHFSLAWIHLLCFQMKKGVITKGGRFRPHSLSFRTLGGPVLLHRSSVNRFDNAQNFHCSIIYLHGIHLNSVFDVAEEKMTSLVVGWHSSVLSSQTGMFSSEILLQFIRLPCCCSQTVISQRQVAYLSASAV